jgi:iron only hydrogenase large subunit-like protein
VATTHVAEMVVANETVAEVRAAPSVRKPLLASACPGFVCYAEKAQGAWILPHIVSIQSPQALMGTVVRRLEGSNPFLHVAIAPCFDKKLEASRSEFAGAIDMVISSAELFEFLDMVGEPLAPPSVDAGAPIATGPPETPWEARFSPRSSRTGQPVGLAGASGGFAYAVRRALAPDVAAAGDTAWQRRRQNRDFQTSGPVAIVNGFRSMQTLIRLMRTKRSASNSPLYEFVEVMACPSGCLNGGGQVRDEPLARVRAAHEVEGEVSLGDAAAEVPAYGWLYRTLAGVADDVPIGDLAGTNAVRTVATTTYRDVKTESTVNANPLAIQW